MATQIAAQFMLSSPQFNPDEVTVFLGIQPTKTWRCGDKIPKTSLRRKHDAWILSTGSAELDQEHSIDLIKQVHSLLDHLRPHTAKLKKICVQLNLEATLSCVLYVEGDDRPAIHFAPDLVKWLAELHADIDIDLYYLPAN